MNITVQETFTNSAEFGIISQRDFFEHDVSKAENIGGYYIVREKDFVYNPRISTIAPVGPINCNKLGRNGVMSPLYTVFRTHDVDTTYLEWFFKSNYWHSFMYFNGDSGVRADRFSIKDTVFFEMPISLPGLEEQNKIGIWMNNIDNLFTVHQQQILALKKYKRGLLQALFPANGETVPKVRFPGFTDAWGQHKLGDVAQITMGQSPDGSTYSDTPSDYILVQGNADLTNGWVSPRIWTTQKTKSADAGDLIMSVRAPAGAMGKTAYDIVLGRGVAGIKGNECLYQTLVKMYDDGYWKKLAEGSTFESINSNAINNAIIAIPHDIDEQNAIGNFLAEMDNLVTLHQKQHEALKKYKAGLLQQMFI